MLNTIIEKLKDNPRCVLTIDELKILYEINYNFDMDLSDYRRNRNNYEDFVKMFGYDRVAKKKEDINVNTIAFVGDSLIIDTKLPTYNLKYVYAKLGYELDTLYNLENLEILYFKCYFMIFKFDGLESLRRIFHTVNFVKLNGENDLSSIERVDNLRLKSLRDATDFILPQNVHALCLYGETLKNAKNLRLPDSLDSLFVMDNVNILRDLKIPKNTTVWYDMRVIDDETVKKIVNSSTNDLKQVDDNTNIENETCGIKKKIMSIFNSFKKKY